MLSKVDPSLIDRVTVIPGPYGVSYGPGFSFIDVLMIDTPRYNNGYESHARIGYTLRANGGQSYTRFAAFGGSADWGYILSWGGRKGSDYKPGGNAAFSHIPSSYSTQNWLLQIGYDLSSDSRLEVRYERIDDSDHEYPAQIFDIGFMGTDAINVKYISQDACNSSTLTVDTWFNSTRYTGDTTRPGKRLPYPVVDRIEYALDTLGGLVPAVGMTDFLGTTYGDLSTTGARAIKQYGQDQEMQISLGADFRYTTQKISERIEVSNFPAGLFPPGTEIISTNLPRAEAIDTGLFAEVELPWLSCVTTRVGGRLDWVNTTARTQIDQNDTLYGFYIQNEVQVSRAITLNLDAGHGERTPNLVDRYANAIFLGIAQTGFNRVIGTPTLRKERAWQIDAGIHMELCGWNAGMQAFHSWIDDYNLYQGELVADPSGARILIASNAEMVTLAGFESYLELPVTERVTAFGTLKFLEGRDRDIQVGPVGGLDPVDQSLFGIAPMESRLGLRLVDQCQGDRWGLEFAARIVDGQDQVAQLRQGAASIVGLADGFEEPTPGFTTYYIRGYWKPNDTLSIVGGVENLFDKTYQEHLDLRLPAQSRLPSSDPRSIATRVFSPGITPYLGLEWTR
jgi:iron complex outermembrane receptor protein